jgi:hypothetical protein
VIGYWFIVIREDIPAHQRCNQHSHRVRQSLLRDQLSCRAGSLGVGGSAFQLFSLSAFQPFSLSAFQPFSFSAFQLFSFSAFQIFSPPPFLTCHGSAIS